MIESFFTPLKKIRKNKEKYLFKIHKVVQVCIVIKISSIVQLPGEYVNSKALYIDTNFWAFNLKFICTS